MLKLITPPGMLLTTALLVIYSVCAFLIGRIEGSWLLQAAAGLAAIASYGVAMLRPWSRYLLYILSGGFIAKLSHSLWYAYAAGYFDFRSGSTWQSLVPLIPSAVLVLLALLCCYLVYRYFAGQRSA